MQGNVAVITGGGGDLAQAIAAALRAAQWEAQSPARTELDVTDEKSITAFFASLPQLDLLVANAGVIDDHLLATLSSETWDRVLDVNLRGAFLCVRAALPKLLQTRGQILFIGSRSAKHGPIGQSAYAAAKAGLIGLAQSLAQEHGTNGLRCNVVLPGFLETRMTATLSDSVRQRAREEHELKRFNTPEQAARFIASLAALDHVSGQVFQLDSRIDRWT